MAKAFLDTNYILDIFMRKTRDLSYTGGNDLFISPLSIPTICYVHKIHMPSEKIKNILQDLFTINLTDSILKKSLSGPTQDIEDNIQLHSASSSHCDYFLTSDKQLLKMKFFGEVEIVQSL